MPNKIELFFQRAHVIFSIGFPFILFGLMLLSVKHAAFLILPYMLVAFAPFGFVWAFKRIKLGLMVKEDRTGNFLFGFIHLAGSLLGCALVIGI